MYVLVLLLTLAFVLSAANPFAGTWEENPAKSPAAANIPVSQFERDGEFGGRGFPAAWPGERGARCRP